MNIFFIVITLVFSLFYAFKCKEIWFPDTNSLTKSRRFHEFWFNLVGSLTGWIFIYIAYRSLSTFSFSTMALNITWQHLVLLIIGLLGITGLLPYSLWGLSRTSNKIIEELLGKN